ncbi:phosphoenolpyruvate carboxylase [bacterium]|nr:phosphoenolpyruvate carboxylase [bacterium]
MSSTIAEAYNELVNLRYQLYNSLFMMLPLDAVQQTGVWIPLLQAACKNGFDQNKSPDTIVRDFFAANKPDFSERDQIDFLYKTIKYIERQIVLIDALEDSAYSQIHRVDGSHSWVQLVDKAKQEGLQDELADQLATMAVRIVLTAHPTQFYPESVLALISDLKDAIAANHTAEIRDLLDQLGRTPFFRKSKPSPLDEAMMLMNYLSQVFYPAIGQLLDKVAEAVPGAEESITNLIQVGFWPGGDRDGNPFVTVEITRDVASRLRTAILRCYAADLKKLRRRLTFAGIYDRLLELEKLVDHELHGCEQDDTLALSDLLAGIEEIESRVRYEQEGLFLQHVQSFKRKLRCFGFHFASLDIRQDSRIIARTLNELRATHPHLLPEDFDQRTEDEQIQALLSVNGDVDPAKLTEPVLRDTIDSVRVVHEIQQSNGEAGAHRYIISNCRGALDMARVIALFRVGGWREKELTVDIVPLFETIDDLRSAATSMQLIYEQSAYREHLNRRKSEQTVMVGFSDGTKDGGYLMANWAIYRAKEEITRVSRSTGVVVHFFDGRGGPPARGGGNSHLFYSALGSSIERKQIQLTLQGQTISSHYGILQSATHNLEMLLTAGLSSRLFNKQRNDITDSQQKLIEEMASISLEAYQAFKSHPLFVPYLLERSTLKYYGMANIGSRPSRRGNDKEFRFEDLRAIPFVGAWSQLKQNVPGFFGVGTALKKMERMGRLDEVKQLFRECSLFRAFIANSMQSMSKTNFQLTHYHATDERFGELWERIHDEFQLSYQLVLEISGQSELLADNPRSRESIRLREKVVLPLLTIQQHALIRIQQEIAKDGDDELVSLYEKMVMRSLFGNINATRNAV